ncbi:GNAT family N-acetyltransferase [Candidatus Woesearchaeota archaeon]|nr:GNAT family N-acetyltransferase [Candidatus Woesearchaeota archaeon]
MRIKILKENRINEYSKLARETISESKYYNENAKKSEIQKLGINQIKKDLKNKNNIFIYVENQKEIIAFCNGYKEHGLFWINWIGVKETHRKKGVAKKIIHYLEEEMKKKNIHKIWFDTLIKNEESVQLIKKLKYKKVSTLKNHWYNQDFYLWEKIIN